MSKVHGKVSVRETGAAVAGVVVVAYDVDPAADLDALRQALKRKGPAKAPPDLKAARLGSVVTDEGGRFSLDYQPNWADKTGKPANLLVAVLGPEDAADEAPPPALFVSGEVRRGAGPEEVYWVRIPDAALKAAALAPAAGGPAATTAAAAVKYLKDLTDKIKKNPPKKKPGPAADGSAPGPDRFGFLLPVRVTEGKKDLAGATLALLPGDKKQLTVRVPQDGGPARTVPIPRLTVQRHETLTPGPLAAGITLAVDAAAGSAVLHVPRAAGTLTAAEPRSPLFDAYDQWRKNLAPRAPR